MVFLYLLVAGELKWQERTVDIGVEKEIMFFRSYPKHLINLDSGTLLIKVISKF